MAARFTRDTLALIVTFSFLACVLVTFFGPIVLHVYVEPEGWMRIVGVDVLVAVLSIASYIVIRQRVPAVAR